MPHEIPTFACPAPHPGSDAGSQLAAGILIAWTLLLVAACSNESTFSVNPPSDTSSAGWLAGMQAPCRPLNETDLDELLERERSALELEARHYNRAIDLYEEAAATAWGYTMMTYGDDKPNYSHSYITIPDDPLPAAAAAEEYAEAAFAMTPECEFLLPPLERGGIYWTSGYNDDDYLHGRVHREHIYKIWRAAERVEGLALVAESRATEAARLVQRREVIIELGPQPPEYWR